MKSARSGVPSDSDIPKYLSEAALPSSMTDVRKMEAEDKSTRSLFRKRRNPLNRKRPRPPTSLRMRDEFELSPDQEQQSSWEQKRKQLNWTWVALANAEWDKWADAPEKDIPKQWSAPADFPGVVCRHLCQATVQDFWRPHRDYGNGAISFDSSSLEKLRKSGLPEAEWFDDNGFATDEAMRLAGHLKRLPDGELYHLAHVPLAARSDDEQEALWELILQRAAAFAGDLQLSGADFNKIDLDLLAKQAQSKVEPSEYYGLRVFCHWCSFGEINARETDIQTFRASASHFRDHVWFSDCKFRGHTDFSDCFFDGISWFAGCEFDHNAVFENAQFHGIVDFQRAQFNVNARFDGVVFDKRTWFYHVNYGGWTRFRESVFKGPVSFDQNVFEDHVNMVRSVFLDTVEFYRPHFKAGADFEEVHFHSVAEFEDAIFSGFTVFDDVQFDDLINLNGAQFHSDLNMRAPKGDQCMFRGFFQKLRERRSWRREKRNDVDRAFNEFANAFRILKLAAEDKRNIRLSSRMHRLEQIAIRHWSYEVSLLERLSSSAYAALSDYGQSIGRPLRWLVLWLPATFGAVALALTGKLPDTSSFLEAVEFGFWNEFRPFAVWSPQEVTSLDANSLAAMLLRGQSSVLQFDGTALALITRMLCSLDSIAALMCAFFVGLALKRRFQLS